MVKSEKAYVKFRNQTPDQIAESASFLSSCVTILRDNLVLLRKMC